MQWRLETAVDGLTSVTFQSTPLCSGDKSEDSDIGEFKGFQSTPLCSGDLDGIINICEGRISIHATMQWRQQKCTKNIPQYEYFLYIHLIFTAFIQILQAFAYFFLIIFIKF